jgi:ribonuclease R
MNIQDRILEYLGSNDYTPLKPAELTEIFVNETKESVAQALGQLMNDGRVVELKNNKLCLAKDADLIVGRIHFRQSGTALVFPNDDSDTLLIPAEETGVALHGDTVIVRLIPQNNVRRFRLGPRGRAVAESKERLAKVIRVIRRAHTKITGTLSREKNFFHVIPDDPRIVRNIIVAPPSHEATAGFAPLPAHSAQDKSRRDDTSVAPLFKVGDKVVVELDEWKQKHLNPEGRIVAVIGRSHEPNTEHAAIFIQYDLTKEFPPEAEAEAQRVNTPLTDEQIASRLDLRNQPVFTIDPTDSKDFDDALHIERLPNGKFKVGIHIADVSAYVQPGSALDREAERRGNSTYLVGEVVPMLPHSLSSGICSLIEAENRLTKSVLATFNNKGEVEKIEFANTVIRSFKRLTYKQAKMFLDENDFEKIRQMPPPPAHQTGFAGKAINSMRDDEMRTIQNSIRDLWEIAKKLRAKRMAAGSLDLDMPEAKIYIDPNGYPERIERINHDESHQLIEEFMLLANVAVARELNRQHFSCIYRVHDRPDPVKLEDLRESLLLSGIKVGDLTNPKEVSKFIELTRTHPKGVYLRGLFLRSLKQACYRATPDGHYGLAMGDYAHFTSPIRRYADFIVHRIFDAYLYRNHLPTAPKTQPIVYDAPRLSAIAAHISLTEQNSTDADRQSVKNRLLEFFELEAKKSPKTKFEAVITDVKNHGLFVELTESMAWGFVHVSTMDSDFYVLSEDGQSLVGRRSQRHFSIGDKILVEVSKIDRFKRQMDFALAREHDGRTLPPMRVPQGKENRRSRQHQRQGQGQSQSRRHDRPKRNARPGGSGSGSRTKAPFGGKRRGRR